MKMFWPLLVIILSNTFYNICAKQSPEGLNPFFSLVITYGVAMVVCIILFFTTSAGTSVVGEISKLNWTSVAFGLCVVGLEFGYLNVYKVGWDVHVAPVVSNLGLAVVLLFVGYFLFKEVVTLRQIIGVIVCAAGLILITK